MKFIYYPLVLLWLSIFGQVVLWFGQAKYTLCSSRKYPDPHHGENRKFRRGGGVNGPGNSKGEGGFEAKFTSRWSGK